MDNFSKIKTLEKKLKVSRVDCVKYNYGLDEEVQNFKTFDSQVQISDDGLTLMLINRKPVANKQYVLEADPNSV
jgi:hypothetical protein